MAKLSHQDATELTSLARTAIEGVVHLSGSRCEECSDALRGALSEYELKDTSNIARPLPQPTEEEVKQKMLHEEEKHRLEMLHDQEEHCLKILKQYECEILFALNTQANLRREAASFFANTLKEVTNSLKESQIDEEFQKQWAKTLVDAYVKSIELSTKLVEESVLSQLDGIRAKEAKIINGFKEK